MFYKACIILLLIFKTGFAYEYFGMQTLKNENLTPRLSGLESSRNNSLLFKEVVNVFVSLSEHTEMTSSQACVPMYSGSFNLNVINNTLITIK